MNLLDNLFKQYYDTWFYAYAGKHKEKSLVRFVDIKMRNKTKYIRIFAYYPKTQRVDFYKISTIKHMSWLDMIEMMDPDTEMELNALFAKTLLTQRDEYIKDAF